jgi:hypothetical protein
MNTGIDHSADYKALSVLTKALIAGVLFFSAISILIHFIRGAIIHEENLGNRIFAVVAFMAAVIIIGARFIYTKRVNRLMETNQSSKEKLDIFRAITITHMALCELPAILSCILFICFGNFFLFLPVAIAIVEMIKKFPTQQRIESVVNSGTF